jgi:hypothetical protein
MGGRICQEARPPPEAQSNGALLERPPAKAGSGMTTIFAIMAGVGMLCIFAGGAAIVRRRQDKRRGRRERRERRRRRLADQYIWDVVWRRKPSRRLTYRPDEASNDLSDDARPAKH